MSLTIIGCGNMGTALASGVLSTKIVQPEQLIVIDHSEQKREQMVFEFGCKAFASLTEKTVSESDTVILAVKPQGFSALATSLAPLLQADQLLISIMAGIDLKTLREKLGGHRHVVRAMPNLPAKISQGMSVLIATSEVSRDKKEMASDIFRSIGEAFYVEKEDLIDAATAVSGSGPGFVFALIEGFLAGASKLGFTDDQAKLLVAQTFQGSVRHWHQETSSAAELKTQVASRGGTTEAGLKILDEAQISLTVEQAITSAYKRAKELQKSA